MADIPDDAVLPSYLSRLQQVSTDVQKTADHCVLVQIFYFDSDFKYFRKDGAEIFPYVEYIKLDILEKLDILDEEKEGEKFVHIVGIHLVGVVFVTDDGEIFLYADDNALKGPATDKLTKADFDSGIKKIPREK